MKSEQAGCRYQVVKTNKNLLGQKTSSYSCLNFKGNNPVEETRHRRKYADRMGEDAWRTTDWIYKGAGLELMKHWKESSETGRVPNCLILEVTGRIKFHVVFK